MPEGHTIHRAARRLRSVLLDRPLERVVARGPYLQQARAEQRLTGATVVDVWAHGKNLALHLDTGDSIYSHLKMDGAWHLYRHGEKWRRSTARAWLELHVGEWVAVEFDGPVLELHRRDELERDTRLTRLGPDILVDPFDDAEYLRRMRIASARAIGEAVMDQSVVAGIGNIYKSETLFLCGIDPWGSVADLDDEQLLALRRRASTIMADGVLDPRAITYKGPGRPGQWAYGRGGQPCRRCGTRIRSAEQGTDRRVTYWCPRCQPPRGR